MTTRRSALRLASTLAAALAAGAAAAHDGHGGGFAAGFLHPLSGWDHVAAMVAVGLWAACLGATALWVLPAAFLAAMALGGGLAMAGLPFPAVQFGVAISAAAIGAMVALTRRPPVRGAAAVVGFFALFHGHAHGVEAPAAADLASYAAGFVIGAAALHVAGVGLGLLSGSRAGRAAVRGLGGLAVAAGLWFTAAAFG